MAAPRVRVLPPASKEGHELSNYRLLERIGEDDLATVYRAVHTTLDRPVDVHILRRSDRVSASRFQLAGRLGARLHHPNIMPVIDAGHDDHYGDYLVTPRLAGRTLAEVFRTGLMESLLALRVFSQIGAALDSIHQQQIVHRDVRPEHVVLTPQGTAYLTSFGLAATPDELDLSSVDDADFATPYTAPEQRLSGAAQPTQDLYSLGAVLYHALHGEPPPSDPATMRQLAERDPQLAAVDRVLRRLLAPAPDQRFSNAEQASVVLRQALRRQIDDSTDDMDESRWEPNAEWLENPLETVFGSLLDHDFITRARARADALHKVGQVRRVLDRWSRNALLRRPGLGQLVQPGQIASYNIYLYELRAYYETRTPPETREKTITSVAVEAFAREQERWSVAVPDVELFTPVRPETVIIPGSQQMVPCTTCDASGNVPCKACNGTGTIEKQRRVRGEDGVTREETAQVVCPNCQGYNTQPCVRCEGKGRMLQEKSFTWSRSGKAYTNEDDIAGLNEKIIRAQAQPVFQGPFDTKDERWYQVAPLQELLDTALQGCSDQTRLLAAELTIRGVPVTEVDFELQGKQRTLALIGFKDEVTGGGFLYDRERIALYAGIALLVIVLAVVLLILR